MQLPKSWLKGFIAVLLGTLLMTPTASAQTQNMEPLLFVYFATIDGNDNQLIGWAQFGNNHNGRRRSALAVKEIYSKKKLARLCLVLPHPFIRYQG